jgi:hypothetical protein
MPNQKILPTLEKRFGRRYARRRLQIEKDHEAQVFGQGINFFHFENLPLSHIVIRGGLVLTGSGAWKYGSLIGYTSVGAGSSIVPVRFNCPPEITLHHLRRSH